MRSVHALSLAIALLAPAALAEDRRSCQELLGGEVRWLPERADEVEAIGTGGFAFFDSGSLVSDGLRAAVTNFPRSLLDGLRGDADGVSWSGSFKEPIEQRIDWNVPHEMNFFPRQPDGLAWIAARVAEARILERELPSLAAAAAARTLALLPSTERVRWNGKFFFRASDDRDDGGSLHVDGMYLRASVPVVGPTTWVWDSQRGCLWASRERWTSVFSGTRRVPGGTLHVAPVSAGRRGTMFLDFEPE